MKRILIFGGFCLILIVVTLGYFILPKTLLKPKVVHFHAGFQVYVDDKLQDFSDFKYMHVQPCTINGKDVTANGDEQEEKAHLHDNVGDVVHVHREGATWGDLFKNIKYPIDENKAIAYSNGQKVDNILEQKIEPYQSIVIFIGKHTDDKKYLAKAVTKAHIQLIEKKSENCGSSSS